MKASPLFSQVARAGAACLGVVFGAAACGDSEPPLLGVMTDAGDDGRHEQSADSGPNTQSHPDAGKRDAGHDNDAERLSCSQLQELLQSDIASASESVAGTCKRNTDCRMVTTQASCADSCTVASVAANGKADLEARIAELETELCDPFHDKKCKADEPVCGVNDFEPRCESGKCGIKRTGCPDSVEGLDGKACNMPGQECYGTGWCPMGVQCSDEEKPGEYRWVAWISLC